eukprot:CAMPEP_0198517776 /NCGR_PEP_ID=MMETSP1462-20131121/18724_1 /TAXON_ID=1333877 /ORGANISM="Brandtodinium nutriculum, Strain RCC3387" /LENGTH=76 /DNA_ID=CAMNT_0044247349 /DNA_START=68 /DNA_END=295 /DNA_ORIENTATION=-
MANLGVKNTFIDVQDHQDEDLHPMRALKSVPCSFKFARQEDARPVDVRFLDDAEESGSADEEEPEAAGSPAKKLCF